MLQEYSHFNPKRHDLKVKIAVVRSGFHCKHNINYHFIWIPKYRKKVLVGRVRMVLEDIIRGQCKDLNIDVLALEVMPDHLHLFIGARPVHKPCDIVKQLKGNTSIQLRRVFPNIHFLGYRKHYKRFPSLWARGYYCGSAGHVSQDAVARYIAEQDGKDVFELLKTIRAEIPDWCKLHCFGLSIDMLRFKEIYDRVDSIDTFAWCREFGLTQYSADTKTRVTALKEYQNKVNSLIEKNEKQSCLN